MKGNPRCEACAGRGVVRRHGRWCVCDCVRGTPESARAEHLRRINDPRYKSLKRLYEEQRRKDE